MQRYEISLNGRTIWSRTTTEQAAMQALSRLSDLLCCFDLTGVLELTGGAS